MVACKSLLLCVSGGSRVLINEVIKEGDFSASSAKKTFKTSYIQVQTTYM